MNNNSVLWKTLFNISGAIRKVALLKDKCELNLTLKLSLKLLWGFFHFGYVCCVYLRYWTIYRPVVVVVVHIALSVDLVFPPSSTLTPSGNVHKQLHTATPYEMYRFGPVLPSGIFFI